MMHCVRRAPFLAILLGGTVAAAAACGPRAEASGSRTPSAPLPGGGKAVDPGAPEVPWKEKTLAQRVEFMGLVFFPAMQTLFEDGSHAVGSPLAGSSGAGGEAPGPRDAGQERRPFRCQTCHGETMVDVAYRMPNGLFPLPSASPYEAALAYDEKAAHFMMERVVPAVRELFRAGDPGAVGCHSCHAVGELPPRAPAR